MADRGSVSLGLPKLSLHGLRHTHATLALQAGVHPKVVSERLGHATVSLPSDVCSHAIPALQEPRRSLPRVIGHRRAPLPPGAGLLQLGGQPEQRRLVAVAAHELHSPCSTIPAVVGEIVSPGHLDPCETLARVGTVS